MDLCCQILMTFEKEQLVFYEELYRSELLHEQTDNVFFENLPQLSKEGNAGVCKALTLEELEKALQSMVSGKALGVDGLSVDFYKSFRPMVGPDLLEMLKEKLASGQLPTSCRRAILTLILEKRRPKGY